MFPTELTNPPPTNWAVRVNEALKSLRGIGLYAPKDLATTGLTLGYFGGWLGATSIADGTVGPLATSNTSYIVAHRTTGAVTHATNTTNWDDTATYGRLFVAVTDGSGITSLRDWRLLTGGIFASSSSGGTAGKHALYIPATAMRPSVTGGCASVAAVATSANQPDLLTLDFDQTTQEYAQFSIVMPKSWNKGTLTFKPHWSHASGGSAFGVVWNLQALAVSNDDAIAQAYGTAQTSTDTGGTANDLYAGPESSAITVAGTPAAEDMVFFRLSRVTGDGSDTLDLDARLHGITLFLTTDAENDA